MSLRSRIEAALSVLVGLPIWDACRVLNMEMFDIGDRVEVVNRRKEKVEIGTYSRGGWAKAASAAGPPLPACVKHGGPAPWRLGPPYGTTGLTVIAK